MSELSFRGVQEREKYQQVGNQGSFKGMAPKHNTFDKYGTGDQ